MDKLHELSILNTAPRGDARFAPNTGAWKEMAVGVKPSITDTLTNIPLIGQLGPQQLSDMFFTGQQRGAKRHPLGEVRGAGAFGDVRKI